MPTKNYIKWLFPNIIMNLVPKLLTIGCVQIWPNYFHNGNLVEITDEEKDSMDTLLQDDCLSSLLEVAALV